MEVDPLSAARPTLKHRLNAKGGNSPTHKKPRDKKETPEPSSDANEQPSPMITAAKRKMKPLVPHAKSKRTTMSNPPPSPPRFNPNTPPEPPSTERNSQFTLNPSDEPFSFETPKQPPRSTRETKANNNNNNEPEDNFPNLNEEWELDPETSVADMLKYIREGKETQIVAIMLATKGAEWHIFRSDGSHPDLDHHSDNQYDFLPSTKLEAMIDLWHNPKLPTTLTNNKKSFLGEPRIKKILVKVVCQAALPEDKRTAWFQSAILSTLAQNKADVKKFTVS